MKIYIVGPSCVGKTRLGDILAKEFKIGSHIDLDLCFNDMEALKSGVYRFNSKKVGEEKYRSGIKNKKSWVVEGVFPVMDAFEKADKIILIKYFVALPLFFQWKRYFTDKRQRETYGIGPNLKLSPDILRQYFSRKGIGDLDNPLVFSISKYEKILKKYKEKVIRVNSPHDLEVLINNWRILSKD